MMGDMAALTSTMMRTLACYKMQPRANALARILTSAARNRPQPTTGVVRNKRPRRTSANTLWPDPRRKKGGKSPPHYISDHDMMLVVSLALQPD